MNDQSLDTIIDQLAKITKPLVERIEALPMTTKDHYGDYMLAIERVVDQLSKAERKPSTYLGVALAFQRAGANRNGVQSALRVMGYL